MDMKSLELFVRIATAGAIGKAGKELGLSRTAATQRIQELEARVGAQLLHRTTRNVSLSGDGEIFLGHARRILDDVDAALSDLQTDRHSVTGELRVSSSASFGRKYLAPYVSEFLERYPKTSVNLHLSDTSFDIVENGFDMAIRLGEKKSSSLKIRQIGESPRIVVAAPSYLERYGTPQSLKDLRQHNCIIRSEMRIWVFRDLEGVTKDVKIGGRFSTNLAEAITEAALAGSGLARKCKWEISEHLRTGELVEVLADCTVLPEWGIYAVRPPSRIPSTRVRAFTDFMTGKFRGVTALQKS
ncbi:MAG: LysR substrate-binding domain-containing protein [Pseudomonadota bacterium]